MDCQAIPATPSPPPSPSPPAGLSSCQPTRSAPDRHGSGMWDLANDGGRSALTRRLVSRHLVLSCRRQARQSERHRRKLCHGATRCDNGSERHHPHCTSRLSPRLRCDHRAGAQACHATISTGAFSLSASAGLLSSVSSNSTVTDSSKPATCC